MIAFLTRCGLTRDSVLLVWGKVLSLCVLITTGVVDPASFGLSEKQKHYVMVAAGAIAYIAGQLSTSGLPGKSDSDKVKDPSRLPAGVGVLLAIALAGAAAASCGGKVRHVAVVADASIAQVVFALDDAEYEACHQNHVLSADQCAKLDPVIKKALLDMKALTLALQATPKDGPLPATLPALLKDLNDIGAVIDSLGAGPTFSALASKARQANASVLGLLTQFAGGQ
jgi:hypothetical protein